MIDKEYYVTTDGSTMSGNITDGGGTAGTNGTHDKIFIYVEDLS